MAKASKKSGAKAQSGPIELDVAVVGGGVSGTYSAWRLQAARGAEQRIALFEYSDRIGGRLFSKTLPGLPNVVAELGGMRYIPTSHIMVANLVTHLDLPTKNFPMGAPAPVGAKNNLFYLRGQYLRYRELSDPAKVPYKLDWSEQGYGPEDLQVKVMNYLCPNFANMSLCEQMNVKVFGKEIWKYGFWDLLYRVLSNEGYQFMKDAGGYEANVANASAVTQLPATEYSDETVFLTLRHGFQALPLTLAKHFAELPGVLDGKARVHMNQRLAEIRIDDGADYRYTLVFRPTVSENGKTRDVEDGEETVVRAKKLILGMPRRSLELIKSDFFDDPWLKKNLTSVLIQSAFKMFFAYEQPWWRSLGLVAGRSVTDLPIRQMYYMGTECEQEGGKPWLNSLAMVSYNDIGTVPFWKGLENDEPYRGFVPRCIEPGVDQNNVVPQMAHMATREMVYVAQRQVAQLHDQLELPLPYSTAYQEWGDDPYGGGWHEWKANYRLDEIMCRMRKPVDSQDIFIVGEAYSYGQGWVEGALTTAESTLESFFGLPRPDWLPPESDYPLMPVPVPEGCSIDTGCQTCQNCAPILDDITQFAYKGIDHDDGN
ncbi:flavin monoamine oxidase family protein [Chitinimonas koreensis]|uniref:flavin monoamine oxidase family protein n=1 Tax=Chitinimonas koreensis TaxID=356302 RepID=UPI000424FD59|nr:FAD-dependent oxidoreductase [Chitinimonas koreensis]QNM97068.1 FAD-dependent oxidoreductase [Chitinimonas koreensis]